MSRRTLWCASATGILSDTSARYWPVGDTMLQTGFGAEATVQVPYRTPGVHSNLTIVAKNSGTAPAIVTFRVNGADGNQSISIPTGAGALTVYTDAIHTDTIVAGDKVSIKVDATGGANLDYAVINGVFLSSSGSTVKKHLTGGFPSTVPAVTTKYVNLLGGQQMSFGSGESGYQMSQTEVMSGAAFGLSANSLDGPLVITLRKNGADTAITMTVPSGSTTVVEDTAHSATFDATDLFDWKFDLSGTSSGSFQPTFIAVEGAVASGATRTFAGNGSSSNSNFYDPVGGDAINIQAATAFGVNYTASHLQVRCFFNTSSGNAIFQFIINGTPGNQTVTVPAGATGTFEDTTNTDTIGPTDQVQFLVSTDVNGGAFFDINWLSLVADSTPPVDSSIFIAPQMSERFVRSGIVM